MNQWIEPRLVAAQVVSQESKKYSRRVNKGHGKMATKNGVFVYTILEPEEIPEW